MHHWRLLLLKITGASFQEPLSNPVFKKQPSLSPRTLNLAVAEIFSAPLILSRHACCPLTLTLKRSAHGHCETVFAVSNEPCWVKASSFHPHTQKGHGPFPHLTSLLRKIHGDREIYRLLHSCRIYGYSMTIAVAGPFSL
jgi:hypothetical protein